MRRSLGYVHLTDLKILARSFDTYRLLWTAQLARDPKIRQRSEGDLPRLINAVAWREKVSLPMVWRDRPPEEGRKHPDAAQTLSGYASQGTRPDRSMFLAFEVVSSGRRPATPDPLARGIPGLTAGGGRRQSVAVVFSSRPGGYLAIVPLDTPVDRKQHRGLWDYVRSLLPEETAKDTQDYPGFSVPLNAEGEAAWVDLWPGQSALDCSFKMHELGIPIAIKER